MVAATCLYWLRSLSTERIPVANLNDGSFHAQMIRFAGRQISNGQWPFASWYPQFGLGSPFLQHYQSGPAVLASLVGQVVGDREVYTWSLWLLLGLWPIALYVSARLFELDRVTAVVVAVLGPVLVSVAGYGYEHGSYLWRGYGLWTQATGMVLLPLAWALTWQAVVRGRHLVWATAALAAVTSLHFLSGYQALLAVGIWVLVGGRGWWPRIGRAAVLGVAALLMSAWAIVPLVIDARYTAKSIYLAESFYYDSFGAKQILTWLVQGDIYDTGRFPIITLFVALGAVVSALRWTRSPASRAVLSMWVFSLLLWFGPLTWGSLVRVLPGSEDLFFHRFIASVHLSGLLLAGVGVSYLLHVIWQAISDAIPEPRRLLRASALVVATALVALTAQPAYAQIRAYDELGASQIEFQQAVEATDGADVLRLINRAKLSGPGRVYAGARNNWGQQYAVGQVPVYAILADQDVDAVGFTLRAAGISADVEASFNAADPAQLKLLGVRYLIFPQDRPAPVGARLLEAAGRHRLYEFDGATGLLTVGDLVATTSTDRVSVQAQAGPYLASGNYNRQRYNSVVFDGDAALPVSPTPPPATSPGRVLQEVDLGEQGRYASSVSLTRPAAVILKSSYDGRWTAYVDGTKQPVGMVSPSFVGVLVPAGEHGVEFVYVPYDQHELLIAVGLASLLLLAVGQRLGCSTVPPWSSPDAGRAGQVRTTARWRAPVPCRRGRCRPVTDRG